MKTKLLISLLIMCLMLEITFTAFAVESKTCYLTDGKTDNTYTVEIINGYISVSLNEKTLGKTYVQNIDALSIYGDILTLYTVDNLNGVLTVFRFEFLKDFIDSESVNTYAFESERCFTSDANGCVYYVSGNDISKLCVYKDGIISEVAVNEPINQLLCIDGENVIVVTTDCTYIYGKNILSKAIGHPLSPPACYVGDNTIRDINAREYTYENGIILEKQAHITTTYATTITPKPYADDNCFYAEPGTTVAKLKKAFADFEITKIAKADGNIIESGKAGTGTTITLSTNETITVIIYGELTGEGNINSRDLKAILNHLSEKELLEGDFLTAADIDGDGKITTKDALMIAKMY